MLNKINDINVVLFPFLLCVSLISITQNNVVDTRQLDFSTVVQSSNAAVVPTHLLPSVLVLTQVRDMNNIRDVAGLRTVGTHWFSSIGIGIVEFALPSNDSEHELINQLTQAFPSLITALNEIVVPLGTSMRKNVREGSSRLEYKNCGSNERIGVIDGPVNADHAIFKRHSIARKSFVSNKASKTGSAHSIGVVSVLVDTYARGSSQPMDILVGEILEQRDGGVAGSLLSVIKALDWLVGEGATVINMSFQSKENAVFSRVLDSVAETGTIMVAAAGNKTSGSEMKYPAAHPKVLAVTAIDSLRNAAPQVNHGKYIDFAAPGLNVPIATLNGTGRGSGTSYAAPYVTSVVALALEGGAPREVDTIRRLIARNAIDLGESGKDDVFGWGLPKIEASCSHQQFSRR